MFFRIHFLSFLLWGLLLGWGCKKETIQPQNIQRVATGTGDRLNKILFVNDSLGFVVGGQRFYSSTILKTTDGGNTFHLHSVSESSKGNYGIALRPDGVIVIVGFDAKFITSADDGNQWQVKQLNSWRPLKDVAFFNNHEGIIIDGHSFLSGVAYKINGDGETLHRDSVNYEMNDIEITPNGMAYVAATGAIIKSEDKGLSWKFLNVKDDNFSALFFLNNDEAWACGTEGSIVHTRDGGNSWTYLRKGNKMNQKKYHFQDIVFSDPQTGFVAGENGIVLKTTDGGKSWTPLSSFTHEHLRQTAFCPDGDLLVCGDGGTLFKIKQ